MPFVKVYIHFVWSTKNRKPFLNTPEIRSRIWQHIKDNSVRKGIFIDFVNGHADHCHCLVSLAGDQTIENVAQLIKGESSFWINQQEDLRPFFNGKRFGWQDEYFAISVSKSMIERTRNYIKNQEEHHKKSTFQEEYDAFLSKHEFKKLNNFD